nr:MAG TPA: hypothetical protein [Caudoviricetes sp.]
MCASSVYHLCPSLSLHTKRDSHNRLSLLWKNT